MSIELDDITSGYNVQKINSNFQKVENYVNDNLLHRAQTGVAGEAMMERDLDMNGNEILNYPVDVSNPNSLVNKEYVDEAVSKTLRFTDTIPTAPYGAAGRADSLQGYNNAGAPVPIFSFTETADLALKLASYDPESGAALVGTQYNISVQEMLSVGRVVYPEMFGQSLVSPTDDDIWDEMCTYLEGLPDTLLGTSLPYTIDLKGKSYTFTRTHNLDINVNIINGTLLMNGGNLVISREAVGERTRRVILKDLKVRYVGTVYFPDALIKLARCYNSFVINCDFWAGDTTAVDVNGKPLRSRYGLWMGSKRAWGCGIVAGEYFGGEIPCRIGYTNDHTGITVTGGATFHHGWVGNLLMCNPAGFFVGGVNIEHSENGAWGLCITSGTNADLGVINPAHGGEISGVYFYNNGNGSSGTTNTTGGVIIGYDAPGTTGFDVTGALITSQNTAHSIIVKNSYIVSPKQAWAVKMRGLASLEVVNNKYTYAEGSYGIIFEGTCARSAAYGNRNQSTGVFDEVEYTSTNKPLVGIRSGTFTPQLTGATTSGSITYSTRGGDYSIVGDVCNLSFWMTVGSISTQPVGDLTVTLPVAIASGRRSGSGAFTLALAGSTTRTVNTTGTLDSDITKTVTSSGTATIPNSSLAATTSLISGTSLRLYLGGAPMQGSVIQNTSAIQVSISYPVTGAVYTGV